MLHQAEQSFVMNLQGGHFLFRGQTHDARCTCCYLLHGVLLECVLIKQALIKRKSIHIISHTAVLNGSIMFLFWVSLQSSSAWKRKTVLPQWSVSKFIVSHRSAIWLHFHSQFYKDLKTGYGEDNKRKIWSEVSKTESNISNRTRNVNQ